MAYSPEAAAVILRSCTDEDIAAALQRNPELAAGLVGGIVQHCTASCRSGHCHSPTTADTAGNAIWHAPKVREPATQCTAHRIDAGAGTACSNARSCRTATADFAVPVRGRDVPRHQSRARSQAASGAWHLDRAGNSWQDDRSQSRDRAWQSWHDDSWHGNWWHGWRNWQSNDRWGWDDRQSPPRGSRAQPDWHDPTEAAPHVDVQRDGWQWSFQLDEAILHSKRGRPYYRSRKSRKFLCAMQCTATHCNHMRPACNFPSGTQTPTTTPVTSAVTAGRNWSGAKHSMMQDRIRLIPRHRKARIAPQNKRSADHFV